MKNRNDHIKLGQHIGTKHLGLATIQIIVIKHRFHIHLGALFEQSWNITIIGNIPESISCIPFTLLGDIYRSHIITLSINGMHSLVCRNNRYFVLGGSSTEKHTYISFHIKYVG